MEPRGLTITEALVICLFVAVGVLVALACSNPEICQ